jgi:hypothetical protein
MTLKLWRLKSSHRLTPRRKGRQDSFWIKAQKTLSIAGFTSSLPALRLCVTFFLTPRRKERKGGIAENSFIVFLIECDGVKRISRKDNSSLNISLGVLCAFA